MADNPTAPTPGIHKARRSGVASSLALEMVDTTWRMFVPTIGLLMLGRYLDRQFGTKPWLMLAGAMVGAMIAAMLVKRQLSRSKSGDEQ